MAAGLETGIDMGLLAKLTLMARTLLTVPVP